MNLEYFNSKLSESNQYFLNLLEEIKNKFKLKILSREYLADIEIEGKRLEDLALIKPLSFDNVELEFFKKFKFNKLNSIFSVLNVRTEEVSSTRLNLRYLSQESEEEKIKRLSKSIQPLMINFKLKRESILKEAKDMLSREEFKNFHKEVDKKGKIFNDIVKRI